MYLKEVIKFVLFPALLLIAFLLTFIIPIKFCLPSFPLSSEKDFYVLRFDSLKNFWVLAGDKTGLFEWETVSDYPVFFEGKDLQDIVSGDLYLWDTQTHFIVWGEMVMKETLNELDTGTIISHKVYTIRCDRWDILERMDSRNSFRLKFSKKYLTIYDYKWFDDFRRFLGEYQD